MMKTKWALEGVGGRPSFTPSFDMGMESDVFAYIALSTLHILVMGFGVIILYEIKFLL